MGSSAASAATRAFKAPRDRHSSPLTMCAPRKVFRSSPRTTCATPQVFRLGTGVAERRLRESTLLQVVPKEQTRLPSSACLSQSFSYHADLLEDDGDGLRTPPGARGGAGQLI